ncbi:alkaline phosphatase PafA [Flavobacterium sp. UMI-01]|uniref:alkaline phosphatase PafA n=1 Tax=Flavobacterium sp. UMI-01 TaxID=1441053 RepID=UPI001C7CBD08|nr:alkaline phosphatase PafA [Flavobacterium sp. UMI-01]GIZ10448.1 alkaline phosphatase family protein [Flavobacterium sp. UMI-01]
MKKNLFLIILTVLNLSAQQRPKLVVGIVVDQMKKEYLSRFYNDFSEDGFKRLLNNGFSFENMHYNYLPTYTAPGHASIYTGTTPNHHGIVGNDWFNKKTAKSMYCTDDTSVKTVGNGTKSEGEMSPVNLLSTTITDELRMSTNFEGKVIALSLKDRGAILPGGHFANWAFWYSKTGDFISSTFYGEKLPQWVVQFNEEKHYLTYLNKDWTLLKPLSVYNESLVDNNPYEGKLYNSKNPVFPYDLKDMFEKNDASVIRTTPFGNDFLAEFAMRAIKEENLGKDDVTDFLTVSFSSTDYVGHLFGPRSIELQDTYLRMDETLATLLRFLDKSVGKDNYMLFLTADHAGAENVNFLKDNKYNVKSVPPKEIRENLKAFSQQTYGADLVLNYSNFNIFFDKVKIKANNWDLNDVKNKFKTYLMNLEHVKRVYTEEEILAASGNDMYLANIQNGYDPIQNGDLVVVDKPGYIESHGTGTTHGTIYTYDTHVPALFYGWKIKKGKSFQKSVITQLAPTIAQKIQISLPNASSLDVLEDVLID